MENKIKCFSEEHKEIDAISFCNECRIYMCDKCDNTHTSFFKNHHTIKLDKEDKIFTGFCEENDHPNKLDFFCKNHNKLCCLSCLCKLSEKGLGKHKDCNVCFIEDIKEEKKNILKENIKYLEELHNKFDVDIEKIKEIIEKVTKDKDDLKLTIQNLFTKIRNALNKREDQILQDIDNLYNEKYFKEDIIKMREKLQHEIKSLLDKGNVINKEWDNINLYSYINESINIENNIKNINNINGNINKFITNNKIIVNFFPKEEYLNEIIQFINSFGKVYLNNLSYFRFQECPKNIKETRIYSLSGENNNILTKTGPNGRMGSICENELDKSIEEHKWKIKLLKVTNNNIFVGVAPIDFDIQTSDHYSCGWYLYCYNSNLYSGPPFKYSNVNLNLGQVNDEIVIVMNMKKRTLKFIINNEDRGDSYKNMPIDKPLFPAVMLYYSNDSVEITKLE